MKFLMKNLNFKKRLSGIEEDRQSAASD